MSFIHHHHTGEEGRLVRQREGGLGSAGLDQGEGERDLRGNADRGGGRLRRSQSFQLCNLGRC